MKSRLACVAAVVAMVVLGSVATADAGVFVPNSFWAREPGGPYSHDVLNINLAEGKAKTVYFKAKSVDPDDADVTLRASAPAGYKVKWFRGINNVTSEVNQMSPGGFTFHLKSGKSKVFRVKVKALTDPEGQCVNVTLAVPMASVGQTLGLNETCA